VFAGPDPLAGRPPLAHDVVTLQAVIAAEENLIHLYRTAISGGSGATGKPRVLYPLLAQHEQHLTQLRARLIVPPGATATPPPSPGRIPARVAISRLVAAERASAGDLVRRLAAVEGPLAQLFASIAASDATHVTVLARIGG
jgi:hypothetical protein